MSSNQPKHKLFYEKVTWYCPPSSQTRNFFRKCLPQIVGKTCNLNPALDRIKVTYTEINPKLQHRMSMRTLVDWKSLQNCVCAWVCALWLTENRSKLPQRLSMCALAARKSPQICSTAWVCALWLNVNRSKTASALEYARFGWPQIAPKLRQRLSMRALVDRKLLQNCVSAWVCALWLTKITPKLR